MIVSVTVHMIARRIPSCRPVTAACREEAACMTSTQALTFWDTDCLFSPYTVPSTSVRAADSRWASLMASSSSVSGTSGIEESCGSAGVG